MVDQVVDNHQLLWLDQIDATEDYPLRVDFRKRASRDRKELDQLPAMLSCSAFRDVRRDRDGGASQLGAVRYAVRQRKLLHNLVNQNSKVDCSLPDDQVAMVFRLHCG
ncbi:MAG TPA: hypothetical protein VNM36_09195 [Gemmatimonadaceae bacterium]|nr:hypothetical protein [Gemmatimonadaceae bacterium]